MKKKNTVLRKLLVMLMVILTMSTVAAVASVSMQVSAANYYYTYSGQGEFISSLAVSTNGTGPITGNGFTLMNKDCNRGCGSNTDDVFMGYKTTTNPNEAITYLRIYTYESGGSGNVSSLTDIVNGVRCTFYPVPSVSGNADLNSNAGGNYIYAYYTKDPAAGPPLTHVRVYDRSDNWGTDGGADDSSYTYVLGTTNSSNYPSKSDVGTAADLNRNAGGHDLFLQFKSHCSAVTASSVTTLQSRYNTAGTLLNNSSRYTAATVATLTSARTNAGNIVNTIKSSSVAGNYGYFTSYSQAEIDSTSQALINAINGLKTTVTLNASHNGGTCAVAGNPATTSFEVTIGANSSATATVSGYSANKQYFSFNGWTTSSSATSGSTSSVTVGYNTTVYATFKRTLTATFKSYSSGAVQQTATRSVDIFNNAIQGNVTAIGLSSITKDGQTYNPLGWRPDTTAAAAVHGSSATISLAQNATFYAVYSRLLTLVYNANGGVNPPGNATATKYVNAGGTETSPTISISSTVPTRTGHAFTGWNYEVNGNDNIMSPSVIPLTHATTNLYAGWSINSYTLTWNVAGVITTTSVAYSATMPSNVPDRYGYTFAGWAWTNTATGAAISQPSTMPAYNVTATALWTANQYTIRFHGNGADSGSMDDLPMIFGTAQNLPLNSFVKPGHTFAGWAGTPDGTILHRNGASVNNLIDTGVIDLYAKWTINTYSVKFNANSGSGSMANQSFTYGTPQNLTINSFTKVGYTFAGWATSATAVSTYMNCELVNNLAESGVFELFAKWTANTYRVKFNANTGGGYMGDQVFRYDETQQLTLNAFTKPGHSFIGWASSETGAVVHTNGKPVNNLTADPDGEVNLYAKWTANSYTLQYEGNGATGGSMVDHPFTYGVQQNLRQNFYTRTGYTFAGWNTAADGSGTAYANLDPAVNLAEGGTVSLYAQWTAYTYSIKFNANTGSGSMENQSMSYGTSGYLDQNAFTKPGYTFAGWATSANGSVIYQNEALVNNLTQTNGATVNLYAKWTANTYTVIFNANGGTGTMPNQIFTYDAQQNLNPNVFTQTAKEFMRWNTAGDGSGTDYANTASVRNLVESGSITLYARWATVTYPVTYTGIGIDTQGSTQFEELNNGDFRATLYALPGYHLTDDITVTVDDNSLFPENNEYSYVISADRLSATLTIIQVAYTGPVVVDVRWQAHYYNTYSGENGLSTHTSDCAVCGVTATNNCSGGYFYDCVTAKICDICDTSYGEPRGHSYCDWAPASAGQHSRECSECFSGDEGHTQTLPCDYTSEYTTAPTCAAVGKITNTCRDCAYSYLEDIPATGHTAVTVEEKAATCVALGNEVYTYCSVCDIILTIDGVNVESNAWTVADDIAQTQTALIDHSYSGEPRDNGDRTHSLMCVNGCGDYGEPIDCICTDEVTTEPTCILAGVTTSTCDTCSGSYTENAPAALGHTYEGGEWYPNNNSTHSIVCTRCEVHTATLSCDFVTEVITAATCTTDGITRYECSTCAYEYEAALPQALGHTTAISPAVPVTCTSQGLTAGRYCRVCDAILVEQEVIPETGHNFSGAVRCNENGTHEYRCRNNCGEYGDLAICVYESAVTRAATCVNTGITTFTCQDCDHSYTIDEPDALGHMSKDIEAVASTCLAAGNRAYSYCERCKVILTIDEANVESNGWTVTANISRTAIPKLKHSYTGDYVYVGEGKHQGTCVNGCNQLSSPVDCTFVSNITTRSTCTQAGETTYECTVCEGSFTQPLPTPLGHVIIMVDAKPATCLEQGNKAYRYCNSCSTITTVDGVQIEGMGYNHPREMEEAGALIDMLDHNYAGEVRNNENGTHNLKCVNGCGEYNEEAPVNCAYDDGVVTKEPVCSLPGVLTYTCTVCGYQRAEVIPAGGDSHVVVTDPAVDATCTTHGVTEGSHCSVCKTVFVEQTIIPALEHAWNDGVVTTEPTCTLEGVKTFTCGNDASHTKTENIAPLEHTVVTDEAVAPTCTEAGFTAGSYCSVCQEVLTEQEEVPALGHDWGDWAETTGATCTVAGVKERACQRDGCNETETDEISALGHDIVIDEAVAPTCLVDGLTAGSHCSRCADMTVAQETDPALCHDIVIDEAVAATCDSTGLTEGSHCSRCNDATVPQTVTPKLEHTYGAPVVIPPTCFELGKTTQTCTLCGTVEIIDTAPRRTHILDDGTITTPATCAATGVKTFSCTYEDCNYTTDQTLAEDPAIHTGETYDEVITPAICNVKGSMGTYCTGCDELLETQEIDYDLQNHGDHATRTITVEATCTARGSNTYLCEGCDTVVRTEAIERDANNHGSNATFYRVIKAATCTETGEKEVYCEGCRKLRKTEIIDLDNTNHGDNSTYEVVEEGDEPTCTARGVASIYCEGCNNLRGTKPVAALGHERVADEAVAPTCTTTGLTAGEHCSRCDKVFTAQRTVPTLGHDFVRDETRDVAATCTLTGVEAYNCSRCDATNDITIAKLGHAWGEGVVTTESDCDGEGVTTFTCTREGCEEAKTEAISALGHTSVDDAAVAATCTETGLSAGSHCEVCGATIVPQTEIPALGHNIVIDAAVAATCLKTGLTEGSHCTRCTDATVARQTTPALGHDWDEGVETKAPTCTEKGVTTFTCTRCNNATRTEYIDLLDHTPVTDEAVAATCTAAGKTEGSHCSVCNRVLVAQARIPATGHTEVVIPAVEATCTETGLSQGSYCTVCEETVVAQRVVAAKGHRTATDAAVAATCTATGLTRGSHCSVCSEVLVAQEITPALGHTYGSWDVTAATCIATGSRSRACSRCGDEQTETLEINPDNHVNRENVAKSPATCVADGYTEGVYCNDCDTYINGHVTLPMDANAHRWNEGELDKPLTCTEGSVRTYTCLNNSAHTYTENVPAPGHARTFVSGKTGDGKCEWTSAICEYHGCLDSAVTLYLRFDSGNVIDNTGVLIEGNGASYQASTDANGKVSFTLTPGTHIAKIARGNYDLRLTLDESGNITCTRIDKAVECNCDCHSTSFFNRLIFRIRNFFNKLFGKERICYCGINHY